MTDVLSSIRDTLGLIARVAEHAEQAALSAADVVKAEATKIERDRCVALADHIVRKLHLEYSGRQRFDAHDMNRAFKNGAQLVRDSISGEDCGQWEAPDGQACGMLDSPPAGKEGRRGAYPKQALDAAEWAINDLFYDPEKDEDLPGDMRVADWLHDSVTLDELRSWIMGVVRAAFDAVPEIGKPINWPYQQTFDAIAAATAVEGGAVAISVVKFAEAFGQLHIAAEAGDDAIRAGQ